VLTMVVSCCPISQIRFFGFALMKTKRERTFLQTFSPLLRILARAQTRHLFNAQFGLSTHLLPPQQFRRLLLAAVYPLLKFSNFVAWENSVLVLRADQSE
jgi:hypothetical protein